MKSILCLIGGFLLISCAIAQDKEYSFKETYEVSLPAETVISTSDGNIDVIPTDGNQIQVFYIVRQNGHTIDTDRKGLEEDFIVDVRHEGNRLEISVRGRWENNWFSYNNKNVGFRLMVPRQTTCDLRTSDGNIAVKGVAGEQHFKTSDGDISANNIDGPVTAQTSDGSIAAEDVRGPVEMRTSDGDILIEKVTGNVRASTSDGNIKAAGVTGSMDCSTSDGNVMLENVNGDTYARTSDGNIEIRDHAGSFKGVTSDGDITGNIVKLGKELSASAGDGSIRFMIPAHLGLDLDVKAEHIDIPLDDFSGKSDDNMVYGKCNGGGIAVSLHSSDGSVSLKYR